MLALQRLRDEPMGRSDGFTLIEVLVALAVLAIALAATTRAVGMMADTSFTLKQRIVAQWVAQNHLAESRARRLWPDVGVSSGTETQANVELGWQETISATPNLSFRRQEVRVYTVAQPEHALVQLVGYLAKPAGVR